ncbi:MAG: sulfatase-like hydrolase/transferase [Clostridiales bacterium]|nr:sulfatase-like hydrolase/transferase [Clostridiales bacterium]
MKKITLDKSKKVFPIIIMIIGIAIMLAMWIVRLNIVTIVAALYCCILSALILLSLIIKKKVYAPMIFGYAAAVIGVVVYYIIWGADAGFGAFSSGLAGYASGDHPWLQGEGNFGTRLLGNILLALPTAICLWGLFLVTKRTFKKEKLKKLFSSLLSVLLMGTSVLYVFTMNLRSEPNTVSLWDGQEDYLDNVDETADSSNPNVLVILMDDLGYGDISLNGAIYDTPNIDSIGENGLQLTNFYSSYSVCSPARFAAMTGRYPYRGYADNVIYPTVNTFSPLATTRVFNSVEMGGNADGMLGDEITIGEVFQSAGYSTGMFGKWHLGDYGEYLPTNQGFDYFYGSHYANDMTPFYHVREENGEYTIVHGTDELKDQSKTTEYIHEEITAWITEQVQNDEPFLAYYTSPWPHAPVYASDDFDGVSGMGTYVDCITEFDTYLGELFNTMEELGVLEDTIIIFTSDNGPALEGSVNELRGGKYLAYEGGQKVPFLIRWDNANGALGESSTTREQSATLVDLFPTLIELCGITGKDGTVENYLPEDRIIDGVSMTSLLKDDEVIHTEKHLIIHMKREDIKAIQYTVSTESVLEMYPDYDYEVLTNNEYVTFKYFDRIQNDNSAFFDKYRTNWLHILTDDSGENYNRTTVYPEIAEQFSERLDEIQQEFEDNRRGVISTESES